MNLPLLRQPTRCVRAREEPLVKKEEAGNADMGMATMIRPHSDRRLLRARVSHRCVAPDKSDYCDMQAELEVILEEKGRVTTTLYIILEEVAFDV